MSISKVPVILAIVGILALSVGCSSQNISAKWKFMPGDITHSRTFETGSIDIELECCEQESTMLGDMWAGSFVVQNNTDISLRNIELFIEFSGKDGFVIPEVSTDSNVTLQSGEKARIKVLLYDSESEQFIDPKDIDNSASVPTLLGIEYE